MRLKISNFKSVIMWIPLGIVVTFLCGLIYFVAQQDIRNNANEPQIQIAEDTVVSLETDGSYVNNLSPHVDISKNLSSYIIIIDDKYNIVSSNATLDGSSIIPPQGVLENAKRNRRNILTWQPKAGVRSAIVVVSYEAKGTSGYVVVGRSLKEAEIRENNLLVQVFLGWVITIFASIATVFVVKRF